METNQNTETKKPSNPYAFACTNENEIQEGMTLRDYFANSAMQGMLSNSSMYDSVTVNGIVYLSEEAYLIADQMLKQREIENL